MSALNPLRPLTQLQFFLGNGCGVTCQYCRLSPLGAPVHFAYGQEQYLSLEMMIQAIREALPLGLSMVRLSGEPFLHLKFDALLDSLESLELGVTIETGGAGLSVSLAGRLARLPQCKVIIGLGEGSTGALDPRPNAPGDLQTASIAARRLAQAGLAAQVVFTLTRQSIRRVGTVIQLAELLGASSLHFTGAQPEIPPFAGAGSSRQPAALRTDILTVEELIAFGRKVERELARTTRLLLSIDLPPAFRGLHPMARIDGQGRCAVLDSLSVLPRGEYALCGIAESVPELILGRVGADPLATIWQAHPLLADLREWLPDRLEGICGRCIMKTACLGYCAAENYLRSGTFREPNWFCQAAEQAGLFPASRLIENRW